jgi:hypothetical protein
LEVPGYEGILSMSYRALSYPEGRRIQQRNHRISDDAARELASAADGLIMASLEAFEHDEKTGELKGLGMAWGIQLARNLGVEVFETMTIRQAVMGCFAYDIWLMNHWNEYSVWAGTAQIDVDEDQRLDFSPTSSPSSPTTP